MVGTGTGDRPPAHLVLLFDELRGRTKDSAELAGGADEARTLAVVKSVERGRGRDVGKGGHCRNEQSEP